MINNNIKITGRHNWKLSEQIICCSLIDIILRNSAYSPDMFRQYISCCYDKWPVLANGQIMLRNDMPHCDSLCSEIAPVGYWDDFVNAKQICEPLIFKYNKGLNKAVNNDPGFAARFPLLRLSHYPFNYDDILSCLSSADMIQAQTIATQHNIKYGWQHPWQKQEHAHWQPASIKEKASVINVYNYENILSFQFIIVQRLFDYIALPVTFFQNPDYEQELAVFIPRTPVFYNEQYLAYYPDACVWITDNVATALANSPNLDNIVLANLGGDAWIDGLDFSLLQGRRVKCLDDGSKQTMSSILRIASKLQPFGVEPEIEIYNPSSEIIQGQVNYEIERIY